MVVLDQHPYFSAQLIYFFTTTMDTNRLRRWINSLLNAARNRIATLAPFADTVVAFVCVVEIIILAMLVDFLISVSQRQQRTLMLLMFFNPMVALQNVNVSSFIQTGELGERDDSASFEHAERVVENMRESVLLTDRQLLICDFNHAALRLLEVERDGLRGTPLVDALVAPADAPGIGSALAAIQDVLTGVEQSQPQQQQQQRSGLRSAGARKSSR
jgi:PAS domain-containing protein